jgi:hypothetical protein
MGCVGALVSQVWWKIDAALKDHWDSKFHESGHYWCHSTVAKLKIEDGSRNDFPVQQFKRGLRASYRPYNSTAGLFDRRLEFKRCERLIFHNENRRKLKQLKNSPSVALEAKCLNGSIVPSAQ